jgi:hypothetical protein
MPKLLVYIGLPDGMFSDQNSYLGKFMEVFAIKGVGIFYGHLVYFTAIWSILRPFGLFYGLLVNVTATRYILWLFNTFFQFGQIVGTMKNLATLHIPRYLSTYADQDHKREIITFSLGKKAAFL